MRLQVLNGHCLDLLRSLPDESVQCCVTSPPYWGLRDYGTQPIGFPEVGFSPAPGLPEIYFPAWVGHLGLEEDPWMFVGHMVQVFREVRRVLRRDGTLWMNFGDNYAGSWGAQGKQGARGDMAGRSITSARQVVAAAKKASKTGSVAHLNGLKAKDMAGIPWRVAFALQADGWYLRSDVIWHKPNPMPESVIDRPTKAHEYVFLLTKSGRYYYDAQAIKEPVTGNAHPRGRGINPKAKWPSGWASEGTHHEKIGRYPRSKQNASFSEAVAELVDARNKRTVWTVATAPYDEAHFATFPPELIKPCILAGSRPGDTVLDPFGGSGTTGAVALELGRQAVLIELNAEYLPLIEQRCCVTPGLPLSA